MTDRLAGKRAFITGAGQGMARAAAIAFAEEGAEVIAISRTQAKMADLPEISPRITPVAVDVTDSHALEAAVADAGDIDILVNCAGWVADGTLIDSRDEDWMLSWEVNVMAPMRLTRGFLPGMLSRRAGTIVNVASVASSVTGVARRAAYGASKAGMIGLTKAVARDHIGDGIRCNALCPGTTASPSLDDRIAATDDPDATRRAFVGRQPMGRLGSVDEMAAAILWMASDESAFMTGQIVVVDGGQTL